MKIYYDTAVRTVKEKNSRNYETIMKKEIFENL